MDDKNVISVSFSSTQMGNINDALLKLFGIPVLCLKEEGKEFSLFANDLVNIIEAMPQIRKWQIAYVLFREKLYKEGIKLSKDTLRDTVWNQEKTLKGYGFDPEEVIELLEEFIRESTDRIFKKSKKEEV